MVRTVRDSTVIQNESGTRFAAINASGQLAVDAIVSVGATTVNISGESTRITAKEVSGTFPNVYVTQSGAVVSGIPHRLVVAFSGDTTIAKISGETVVTSVSGNTVNTKISGETIRLVSGHNDVNIFAFDPSGLRYNQLWVENSGGHRLLASIDAGAISVQVSGNILYLTSGFNPVQLMSGTNIVKISGESMVVTSGQVQITSGTVTISGNVVQTTVSGNVIVGKISGESVRFGTSGLSYVDNRGFDYDNTVNREIAVTQSGEVRIVGNLSATTNISGQFTNSVLQVSGNPPIPLASITTTSGAALLTMQATKAVFKAYQSLPVTNSSGGTQLLSGQSTVVSIKNLGLTGSFMWVGSSGTGNAPWASDTDQSGLGWFLGPRDSVTIPIHNPELLRVCIGPTTRSGQRISYMISADL